MALFKGSDGQYQIEIRLNNNLIDIASGLNQLIVEVYDSSGVLIEQFSRPSQIGYTDLVDVGLRAGGQLHFMGS